MKTKNVNKIKGFAKTAAFVIFTSAAIQAQTVEDGLKLIQADKIKDARTVLQQVLDKEPNNAKALFYLGKLSFTEGQKDKANEYFAKIAQVNKKSPYYYLADGFMLLAKGDSTNAFEQFEEAVDEANNKDLKVVENVADAFVLTDSRNMKFPMDMLTKVKSNLKIEFTAKAGIYQKIGDLYFKHGNFSLAISNYQYAIDADQNMLSSYVGVSFIYIRIKNYSEAESFLTKSLQADSTYAPAYKGLAELFYTRDKYKESAEMYKKYMKYSDADVAAQLKYATICYYAKDYNESIATLKNVETADPKNMAAKHIIALSYYKLDDAANAISAFDRYFAAAPDSIILATDNEYYAKTLVKSGQELKAVDYFAKAIKMDSSNADLNGDIAAIYYKNKDYANAVKFYQEKEKNAKKGLSVREMFDYAQAYYYMKDYQNADMTFGKITEKSPDLALAYLWRAFSCSSIDTTSMQGLAKPHYEKFIEIAGKTPEKYAKNLAQAYAYLGYFYYLKKDDPQYKDTWEELYRINWEKVLEFDPANAQAKEALKNVKKK